MLSIVLGKSDEDVRSDLWDAVRLELVEQLEGSYKFVHDRVQEAAYSLIPGTSRAAAHLRIGRLLVAHTPGGKARRGHLRNRQSAQPRRRLDRLAQDEREQLAELNLLAGQRAKATTAYASALTYLDCRRGPVAGGLRGSAGMSSPSRWRCTGANASS